ncbi:T9SS type A sorting domain-containing protein [Dyadobacter sp.]|uniref:T9SS type A sorting domain-containing protein n=1 Tax=Dyadobacter sp. TaxID=1914288 RepID=UPI003262D3AB
MQTGKGYAPAEFNFRSWEIYFSLRGPKKEVPQDNGNFIVCSSDNIFADVTIYSPVERTYRINIEQGKTVLLGQTITTSSTSFNSNYFSSTFKLSDLTSNFNGIKLRVVEIINGREDRGGFREIDVSKAANTPLISSNKSLLCSSSESAELTITNAEVGVNYSWSNGANGAKISVNNTGTYSVIAQPVSAGGDQVCANAKSADISIQALTFDPVIIRPETIAKCEGQSIELSVDPKGNGSFSYIWTREGQAVGEGQVIQAKQSGNYKVNVQPSGNNCQAKEASNSITLKFDAPIQDGKISTPDDKKVICGAPEQPSIELTAMPSGLTYNWTHDGKDFGSTQKITVRQGGQYAVRLSRGACTDTQVIEILDNNFDPTIAAAPPSYCSNSPITISANTKNEGVYDYAWKKDGTSVGTNSSALTLPTEAGSFKFLVEITAKNSGCAKKISQELTIKSDLGIAGAKITPPASKTRAIICGGSESSIELTASADASLDGIVYSWQGVANSNAPIWTAGQAGEYTVTLARGSCSATASISVQSGAFTPVIAVAAATIISSPTEARICQGEGAGIKSAISGTVFPNTTEYFTYEWFGGANATVPLTGQTGPNLSINGSGSYSLKMTLTNSGCAAKDATPQAIRVLADPEIKNPKITPNPAIICNKEQGLTLTALADSSAGITYSWSGNGKVGSSPTNYVVFDAGSYTVTFTRGACKVTESVSPREEELLVKLEPTGKTEPIIICSGDNNLPVELKAVSNLSTANIKWYLENGTEAPGNNTENPYKPSQTGSYYATAQFNTCTAKSPEKIAIEALTSFSVNIIPETIEPICEDRSIKLQAQFSQARFSPKLTYTWFQDGNIIKSGKGDSGNNVTVSKNATYTGNTLANQNEAEFTLKIEADGCKATSSPKKIVLKPSRPGIIVLDYTSLEATESIDKKYQWYYKEGLAASVNDSVGYEPISGATLKTYLGAPVGSYLVRANRNECGTKFSFAYFVDRITAANPSFDTQWKIYPNPTSEAITVEQASRTGIPAIISLRNTEGQLLRKISQTNRLEIYPLDNLPSGVYFLEISQGKEKSNKKFVKLQ